MAFIRAKKHGDNTYYYLVENKRKDGSVKQETIAYMGKCPTIEEAYQYWKKIASISLWAEGAPSEIEKLRAKLNRDALYEYRDRKIRKDEEKKSHDAAWRRGMKKLGLPFDATHEQVLEREREIRERRTKQQQTANREWQRQYGYREWRQRPTPARQAALRTLGLSSTATAEEIKSAYRSLAKKHHPDVVGGDVASFRKVTEAYSLLTKA